MAPQCRSKTDAAKAELEALRKRVQDLEQLVARKPQDWSPEETAHLQRLAVVGELCAEMAHEVNQPLAAIKWFAEAALRKLDSDGEGVADSETKTKEELREILRTVEQQAAVCQELTGRLFGTARRSAGDRERVSIADVLHDVLPLVQVLAERYGVRIEEEGLQELPGVLADRLQLGQVLLNLIRNAIEAVAICPPERRRVIVSGQVRDGNVEVTVRDFGVGVPDEAFDRLFERFFTTRTGGTGLGLAICRSIIEGHGGRITVEKNDDFGLSFRFSLPALG